MGRAALTCTFSVMAIISSGMAIISSGVAQAQESVPLSPSQLQSLIKPANPNAPIGTVNSGAGRLTGAAPTNSAWNYVYPKFCLYYTSGGYSYIYMFTTNGGYFYYGVNSPLQASAQGELLWGCNHGGEFEVYLDANGNIVEMQAGY